MGSEEWRRKQKNASTPLATWADNNGVPPRIAGLVADGEASAKVVDILKKGRAIGATLSSAQRTALMGQLRGAGQWHKDDTDAPAYGARRKPAAARRVNSAATTDAVTPAPSSTAPGRRAKRVALAETEPAEIAVEAEEDEL